MGLTERIELRLDEAMTRRIDDWMARTQRAGSRSDALRQLVEMGLAVANGAQIQLTDGDKLQLMLWRDLVRHLKVPTEVDPELLAGAIQGGHYWAPATEYHGLLHEHVDQLPHVDFVASVLGMWDALEHCVDALTGPELAAVKAAHHNAVPRFAGFDGRDERELLRIAHFFVNDLQRFARFKGRDLNSHRPSQAIARRMLRAYEDAIAALGVGRELGADEVIEILQAGGH